jgi:hypothetical protein
MTAGQWGSVYRGAVQKVQRGLSVGHDTELDGGSEVLQRFADQQDIPQRLFGAKRSKGHKGSHHYLTM